jgi:hypothetical protein
MYSYFRVYQPIETNKKSDKTHRFIAFSRAKNQLKKLKISFVLRFYPVVFAPNAA